MNIGKIATVVGKNLLKNAVPGIGLIIDTVNAFLDDDKKLNIETATGDCLTKAVNSLPPDQQMQVMNKQFDVEIASIQSHADIMESFSKADIAGASTRPKIALMMAWLLFYAVFVFISTWAISIGLDKTETLEQLNGSWPMMLSVLGPIIALLNSYFGKRTEDKKARYTAVTGQPLKSTFLTDIITAVRK